MSRHSTEDVDELLKGAPKDRYRAEIRQRGRWTYEVRLITTHTLFLPSGPAPGSAAPRTATEPIRREVQSTMEPPWFVLSLRWAKWKGRRAIAAQQRRDVREEQPWVTT